MDSLKAKDLADEIANLRAQIKTTTDPETLAKLKNRQKTLSVQLLTTAASFKASMKSAPIKVESGKEPVSKVGSIADSHKDLNKGNSISSSSSSSKKVEEAKVNFSLESFLKSGHQKGVETSQKQNSVSSSVDLCFLIDGTSSMQPWIDQTKKKVQEIIKEAQKRYAGFQFRIAVVVYRDFDMGNHSFEIQHFIQEASQVETFLSQVRACGGGDIPEDINGGLQRVLSLKWRSPIKILIHFADAPCHGPEFYDGHDDSHSSPQSDVNWREIFDDLRSLSIEYNFLKINDSTDKMTGKFAKYWDASGRKSGDQAKKAEFNVYPVSVEGQDLIKNIKNSIMSSIQRSICNKSNADEILKAVMGSVSSNDAAIFAQLSVISGK